MNAKLVKYTENNVEIEISKLRLPTKDECDSLVCKYSLIYNTNDFCCFIHVEDDEELDWEAEGVEAEWGDNYFEVSTVLFVPIAETENNLAVGSIYLLGGIPFIAHNEHMLICMLYIGCIYEYESFYSYEEYRDAVDNAFRRFERLL